MSDKPEALPQLADIHVYVPGEEAPSVGGRSFKLASNENPLGSSKAALEAYRAEADKLWLYPDGGANKLRAALAEKHGLDADRIVCGAGSDEIFYMLARAYLAEGDESISTKHAFAIYTVVGQISGAKNIVVDEKDFVADVDAILAAVTPKTKMVWLANPNNPTGTYLPFDEIKRLHAGLPKSALLVLDGAYAEYVRKNDYASGIELVSEFENVVITRTFSKIHGLAALRVGWAYAPRHVIDAINRVRGPFNVSRAAQAAAVAAVQDTGFVETSIAHNDAEMKRLADGLNALGLETLDGVCNFVVAKFPDADGKRPADALAFLKSRGITVRGLSGYAMPEHLRITVGTTEQNTAVLEELAAFLRRS